MHVGWEQLGGYVKHRRMWLEVCDCCFWLPQRQCLFGLTHWIDRINNNQRIDPATHRHPTPPQSNTTPIQLNPTDPHPTNSRPPPARGAAAGGPRP